MQPIAIVDLCDSDDDKQETAQVNDSCVLPIIELVDSDSSDTECNIPKEKEVIVINKENETSSLANTVPTSNTNDELNAADTSIPNTKVNETVPNDNTNSTDDIEQSPEEIVKQLREQLNLLQGKKRSISLLGNKTKSTGCANKIQPNNKKTPDSSGCNTPSIQRTASRSSIEDQPQKKPSDNVGSIKRGGNFIDSLIKKLKGNSNESTPNNDQNEDTELNDVSNTIQSNEISRQRLSPISMNEDDLSNHSNNDFLGFSESDAPITFLQPNVPGLLATPIVVPSGNHSAFVSEELDAFMKENALENSANVALPAKQTYDEAMMSADAEPPKLDCPLRPTNMEKPRTLAEKRQLLERSTDVNLIMMENESTVFREMTKWTKLGANKINKPMIQYLQQNTIPFRRDCWRAMSWLSTNNGKFCFQSIQTADGQDIKIISGRGNNDEKILFKLPKLAKEKNVKCLKVCNQTLDHLKINNLHLIKPNKLTEIKKKEEIIDSSTHKLNVLPTTNRIKPGPLSHKNQLNRTERRSSLDLELGSLESYTLPTLNLEVWPKVGEPLSDFVIPYLKHIQPSECITDEWAAFAVSAIRPPPPKVDRRKRKPIPPPPIVESKPFNFDIPYCNNQTKILVRRQIKPFQTIHSPKPIVEDNIPFTFMRNIKTDDKLANEIGNILGDMINSVSIGCNELAYINIDLDDTSSKEIIKSQAKPVIAAKIKKGRKKQSGSAGVL